MSLVTYKSLRPSPAWGGGNNSEWPHLGGQLEIRPSPLDQTFSAKGIASLQEELGPGDALGLHVMKKTLRFLRAREGPPPHPLL